MTDPKLNIFIVDDNKLLVISLKKYLENRFGSSINISTFYDGESCLENINKNTHIVILDYFLDGMNINAKNGIEILKEIKKHNAKTEVIMLSRNEDVAVAIESFRAGASGYVVKGDNSLDKIISLINRTITEPIRIMVREFGVPKFLTLFLFVFIGMATAIYWVMKLLP
ncbi:MAG: response regulator [Bacteroidota bacterium]